MAKLLKHLGIGVKKSHSPNSQATRTDYTSTTSKSTSVQELLPKSPTRYQSSISLSSHAHHDIEPNATFRPLSEAQRSGSGQHCCGGARPYPSPSSKPHPSGSHSVVHSPVSSHHHELRERSSTKSTAGSCGDDLVSPFSPRETSTASDLSSQDPTPTPPRLLDEYCDPVDLRSQLAESADLLGACADPLPSLEDDYSVPYEVKKIVNDTRPRDRRLDLCRSRRSEAASIGEEEEEMSALFDESFDEPWEWTAKLYTLSLNNPLYAANAACSTPRMTPKRTAVGSKCEENPARKSQVIYGKDGKNPARKSQIISGEGENPGSTELSPGEASSDSGTCVESPLNNGLEAVGVGIEGAGVNLERGEGEDRNSDDDIMCQEDLGEGEGSADEKSNSNKVNEGNNKNSTNISCINKSSNESVNKNASGAEMVNSRPNRLGSGGGVIVSKVFDDSLGGGIGVGLVIEEGGVIRSALTNENEEDNDESADQEQETSKPATSDTSIELINNKSVNQSSENLNNLNDKVVKNATETQKVVKNSTEPQRVVKNSSEIQKVDKKLESVSKDVSPTLQSPGKTSTESVSPLKSCGGCVSGKTCISPEMNERSSGRSAPGGDAARCSCSHGRSAKGASGKISTGEERVKEKRLSSSVKRDMSSLSKDKKRLSVDDCALSSSSRACSGSSLKKYSNVKTIDGRARKSELNGLTSSSGAGSLVINTELKIEKQSWYHGQIGRLLAEERLADHREGSFLVRQSESNSKDFSLSLKYASLFNPFSTNGRMHIQNVQGFLHLKIVANNEGKFILGQFSQPFDSISHVIEYYCTSKLPIKDNEHICLLEPVNNV